MQNNVGKICVAVGLLSFLNAAFSAAQHRSYLRINEQTFDFLPLDIILQTLLSFLLTLWGATIVAGNFMNIRATTELENKSFEVIGNRSSFYVFSHRGRVLNSGYSQGSM